MLLAASALCGCGAGAPGIVPAPPLPDRAADEPRRTTVLAVAGSAPEVLGPFDCAQGIEVRAGGRRYCLYNSAASWAGAEARCIEHGGHLATLGSRNAGHALFTEIGSPQGSSSFWIGLAEPAEGRWLWADGTRVAFTAWNPGEPNNAGGNESCGEWLFLSARWNDLDCLLPRGFLCETKSGAGKGQSGVACSRSLIFGDSSYCLRTSAATTWERAQHLCSAAGGNLAVIETPEENQAIARALGVRPTQATGSLWLGLNDRAREGDFRWISGEPVGETAWRAGEPNNSGDEDCTEWSPGDGLWNDLSCDAQIGSLCEAP
jgi:hypothetical protein